MVGKVPADRGKELFLRQRPGHRQQRDDEDKPPDQHRARQASCCRTAYSPKSPAKALPLLPVPDV